MKSDLLYTVVVSAF